MYEELKKLKQRNRHKTYLKIVQERDKELSKKEKEWLINVLKYFVISKNFRNTNQFNFWTSSYPGENVKDKSSGKVQGKWNPHLKLLELQTSAAIIEIIEEQSKKYICIWPIYTWDVSQHLISYSIATFLPCLLLTVTIL